MGLITVASLSNGCSPNRPSDSPTGHETTMSVRTLPQQGTTGIQRDHLCGCCCSSFWYNFSSNIWLSRHTENYEHGAPEGPTGPRKGVTLSKQPSSAATQSSFSISFSQSRLKRSCGNTAITLPIVGNLTSRGICLFKPAGKINAQPDWSGRRKRIFWHYLTNLQRTLVGVAAK